MAISLQAGDIFLDLQESGMKQLCLWRHAKSSWDLPVNDRDRLLSARGRLDAPRVALAVKEILQPSFNNWVNAGLIAASPAERAQATLEAANLEWPDLQIVPQQVVESLYTFDWRDLAAWLQSRGNETARLLIVGHNPALTDLNNWLVDDERNALENLPTAGFVSLSIDRASWADIGPASAKQEILITPKSLQIHEAAH